MQQGLLSSKIMLGEKNTIHAVICLTFSLCFFLSPSLSSGIPQREAEDHWKYGHGYEAAEPPGYTRQGKAVTP